MNSLFKNFFIMLILNSNDTGDTALKFEHSVCTLGLIPALSNMMLTLEKENSSIAKCSLVLHKNYRDIKI